MKLNIAISKLKSFYRRVWLFLGAWIIIGTFIFIIYPWYLSNNAFIKSSYGFKIHAIEYRPNHRGAPHIQLDSGWYLLNIDEMKIVPYIQVGDSIVKKGGSKKIFVFRKVGDGSIVLKEFD